MKKSILIALSLLLSSTGAISEEKKKKLYKWVDKQGNVHYSDEPQKGAKEVKIPELPTVKMKTPKLDSIDVGSNSNNREEPSLAVSYQSLSLASPTNEGVIRNNGQVVEMTAQITPPLQEGHKLQFTLDGQTKSAEENELSVKFEKIEYGVHTAKVTVVDSTGFRLMTSEEVKFALLHIINPKKRKNKK